MIALILGIPAALVAITVMFGSWYTIDQGERGVVLRNGALSGTADPGLHFKMPWIDDVEYISVQSHTWTFDEVHTYSRDQQPAVVRLSVTLTVPPDQVDELYSRYGTVENMISRLVSPRLNEHFKNVFGQFNAVAAVQERPRLNLDVEEALSAAFVGQPVLVEGLQVENIDFSAAYEASIEARMLAEVEVQKVRQNAEREKINAEIVVIQANAAAARVKLNAEALGEQARLIGDGEADAIKARGDALRDNPMLIQLTAAEKWNGSLPTTMPPGGTVPFLNLTPPSAGGTVAATQ